MLSPSSIAVVGAGISGLACAHALAADGHDVIVLDRRAAPGGRIHTERRDGFLVEHGPNSLVLPAPGAERLIAALGLANERIGHGAGVRHRYLIREGRARALPIAPLRFFTSGFFSLAGRLRLLAEPFVAPCPDDETVAGFVRRRFGRELADYVFDPLVGGLYAGDPEHLSVRALFPQLKRLEDAHGSVLRGLVAARVSGRNGRFEPRRRKLFTFREGMGSLPARLAAALGNRMRAGVRVEGIEALTHGGYRLRLREGDATTALTAGAVVVALPAYAAARLLYPLAPAVGDDLAGIDHPPLAVVALGYRTADIAHPLDGLGLLAPSSERRGVLGLLFSSTLFAGRAPDGHALVTAYVGGARQPELAQLPRAELAALVHAEVRALLGARAEPVFASIRYWRHGLPQPKVGHGAIVGRLAEIEAARPGLFITGNYVAGVSTAACIDAALATAARVGRIEAAIHVGLEVAG